MTAQVNRIYIADENRNKVIGVKQATLEENKGIVGDRYHLRAERSLSSNADQPAPINNISLISQEALDTFLAHNNAEIDYGDFRRNIITSGVDLNSLVGREFSIGDVRCIGTELCEPCAFLAATVHRAVLPELVGNAGLRATVINGGDIKEGSIISC
ncbi:MAG: hypothetical protein COA96_12750 [SAR86 cluster bacterium]|uniref:MOSC domain-containing protein n=1 Tax=SAR86 cluster bacterium TaxID=2030880 RepID=A0A2A5AUS4_9GAMM|nr:MAG: hypothetical protein COA96_12750 [SAR86 cluster bacterium]